MEDKGRIDIDHFIWFSANFSNTKTYFLLNQKVTKNQGFG
jgi:hypothetical protein